MTGDTSHTHSGLVATARRAYGASLKLGISKGADRSRAVQKMAEALKQSFDDILEANTLDLEASREMAVPELIVDWLKLTPERLQAAVEILQRLSELSDPLRRIRNADYQLADSQTYCQLMPLGTIALVYEAFPELGAIAAGLCIKTGNSLILKGGGEASHSNAAIAKVLQIALEESGMPSGCLERIETEEGSLTQELITQDQYINLVIPYGRPSLVQQVVRQSTAPVLKSAMGNCYLYWSLSGSIEMMRWTILDSHASEPDPVNAIEKVLIHRTTNPSSLVTLWNSLQEKGFQVRGDTALVEAFPQLQLAKDSEWSQSYLNKTVAFKVVDNLEAAISWINRYSSGHADCIVTESYQESRHFALRVNSASTYINASPRFCRNPARGESIFLGMSNQKGHRRGLISPESLTTVKHIVQGNSRF
ncbi:MAG: Gamma-glutamyl phosphate reductase [Chroococcidiopsis cubana SAG 39.79]|jgi:glutamate-5-semialdehyde dehydrogenase|uniref:Gamma-glutamyl phosphate reductase n=2 Tax=Chroococcidiopsis TaxID=54298 RepID=K9U369_CHRTP|nr:MULTISPECIES: glutamate-5-semialdehyde dehydrogenase [Chroococcidiopsis]PSB42626.1 glutamate-5-semialdehyde dehydrogenase [Cyanosarcina cf. burmensis CCALA 770]AFY89542.1 glutamate-5-semialdehyde dehydrogenase [Chroococcidiopsis thermalis PCC 7203]MDZ4878688.1 Gamma-glutamyl phosphate reductase [Chroococcidiopsis cubana SAG 39.79]PSB62227.1 glutamate-5-semialdehyde dehydrogenase [Chroococcidiopsis cubana CCALA 043]RUT12599.1 gamma-glutamyl phosphate reductase [Chroococcidiopsis cubana SAG 3